MNCNYKVKITDIQTKYKFKVFCTGYDDSEIKEKIDAMYQAWPKASGEGETPTLDNTANATMSIDLKGNTSQVTTTGKNLLGLQDGTNSSGGLTVTRSNNKITFSGTASSTYPNTGNVAYTLGQGTYTISSTNNNYDFYLWFRNSNNETIYTANLSKATKTITVTTNDITAVVIGVEHLTTGTQYNIETSIQIEAGSTATAYEEYTGGVASPNPDYLQDVQVVTGDNTINICGKNLFNKGSISTGYLKEDATLSTDSAYRTSDYISIKPNTTYYKTSTGSPRTKYFDINKIPLNTTTYWDISTGGSAGTFTTPNNAYYLRFSYPAVGSSSIDADTIMIKEGTDTTYEAYTGASYPVNLGTMELCKIGNYQDYICKDNKKWYKYGVIGKHVFTGTEEDISLQSINSYGIANFFVPISNFISTPLKCSHLMEQNTSIATTQNEGMLGTANGPYIRLNSSRASNVADFKTWLGANDPSVYYRLRTPEATEITDTTLISQLNALAGAESYSGQTNISQTNDDKPFILTAKALKDLSNL